MRVCTRGQCVTYLVGFLYASWVPLDSLLRCKSNIKKRGSGSPLPLFAGMHPRAMRVRCGGYRSIRFCDANLTKNNCRGGALTLTNGFVMICTIKRHVILRVGRKPGVEGSFRKSKLRYRRSFDSLRSLRMTCRYA